MPSPGRRPAAAQAGFTLIEMLVSVTVLGVMAAIAAPQLSGPLAETRVRAMTAEFVASLGSARTEAARRGVPVTLCPRAAGSNVCGAGATNWNQGWVLYADLNASGSLDSADQLLGVRTALPAGSRVGVGQATPISVLPSGEHVFPDGSARTLAFAVEKSQRYVVVSRVGRAAVLSAGECNGATQCTP